MDLDPDPPFLPDFWQSVRLLLLEFVAFPSVALSEVLPPFPEWTRRALVGGGFLDLVILVPVVEEALFRGLILGGYVQSHRPARAILLCGLVFAVSHLLPGSSRRPSSAGSSSPGSGSRPKASSSP